MTTPLQPSTATTYKSMLRKAFRQNIKVALTPSNFRQAAQHYKLSPSSAILPHPSGFTAFIPDPTPYGTVPPADLAFSWLKGLILLTYTILDPTSRLLCQRKQCILFSLVCSRHDYYLCVKAFLLYFSGAIKAASAPYTPSLCAGGSEIGNRIRTKNMRRSLVVTHGKPST